MLISVVLTLSPTQPLTLPANLGRADSLRGAGSAAQLGRRAYPGFVGVCSYAFRSRDRYGLGLIHLLAAFAFYAGVGARTTVGLGQARVIPSPQSRVRGEKPAQG